MFAPATSAVERAAILSTYGIRSKRPRPVDNIGPQAGTGRGYDSLVSTKGSTPWDHHRFAARRFDAFSIGQEVERGREHRGFTVEAAAELIGIGRTHWYDKVDGTKPFKWHEVGTLAAAWGAPPGWPVMTWQEGLAYKGWLDEQEQKLRSP